MLHSKFSELTKHLRNIFRPSTGIGRWATIVLLSACAYVLTMFALPDISSIESFASQDNNSSIIDFFERTAAHSGVTQLDTTVTVIAIDDCSHVDIAEVLDIISYCQPKAIGLDVIFFSLDNDTLLKKSLKDDAPLMTLPVIIGEQMPSQSFVNSDTLPEAKFGRVDLAQEHRSAPIRHYFLSVDGQPSFVKQLALSAGYQLPDLDDTEPLRYGDREFNVVSAREMLDNDYIPEDEINGKIVLVGTVNDYNDMHYTPIDNDMPGILIHAHSLATLISGKPVKQLPDFVVYSIALLFTIATIWLCMRVDNQPYANLVSRIIPIGIIMIFIYFCYYYYNSHNLYIDFTIVLAMTASGMLCYDIYIGVPSLIDALWRRIHKTKNIN